MGFNIDRIKANARAHYVQNKWNNVIVIVVWLVLQLVITSVASSGASIIGTGGTILSLIPAVKEEADGFLTFLAGTALTAAITMAISIGTSIFAVNILNMGVYTWFHKSIYHTGIDTAAMFDPFTKKYMNNVLTMLLKGLFMSLWSLLFVIPGIVKFYSYFAVEYIKAECPDMPPMKVLELSEKMMNGHKMDVFVLELSFIGWLLLSALTFNLLAVFYVFPYYYAAHAFAYEEIKADAIAGGRVYAEEFM